MTVSMMEEKKTNNQTESISGTKVFRLLEEVKSEFQKVSWTSQEELKAYTKIVVAFTFLFGMAVYFTDVWIHYSLATLGILFKWVAG